MLIELITRKLNELSKYELMRCQSLNLRSCGVMRHLLTQFKNSKKSRVILAKSRARVVGWALLTPTTSAGRSNRGNYQYLELNTYVEQKYRRRGIGRLLIGRASLIVKRRNARLVYHNTYSGLKLYRNLNSRGLIT